MHICNFTHDFDVNLTKADIDKQIKHHHKLSQLAVPAH